MSESTDLLVSRASDVEDFDEASAALLALKKADRSLARDVALRVLCRRIGDVFYRALAFEILYAVSLTDASAYIENAAGNEDAYVLGSMLDCVTEDVGATDRRDEILRTAALLREVLKCRSADDLRAISAQRNRFDEAYR